MGGVSVGRQCAAVMALAVGMGWAGVAGAASCPTVADPQGITTAFPQQAELTEFEGLAKKKLTFAENRSSPSA